jgi:hypothetical protein
MRQFAYQLSGKLPHRILLVRQHRSFVVLDDVHIDIYARHRLRARGKEQLLGLPPRCREVSSNETLS